MRKIVINNIGPDITEEKGFWEDNLIGFHKLQGYMKPDNNASFSFTTNAMSFMYHFDGNKFDFQWKSNGRWKYRRSRVSYIPAERNIVSVVPNWLDVNLDNDNIRNFISDWYMARKLHGTRNELWELRDGELSSEIDETFKTLQDEDGLIRGNYFDRIMHNIMADFTNYSAYRIVLPLFLSFQRRMSKLSGERKIRFTYLDIMMCS